MSPYTLMLIMVFVCTIVMFLERTTTWLTYVGGWSIVILIAIILSSVGLIPKHSVLYTFFSGKAVSIAICFVLFNFNFKDLFKLPKGMFRIYLIGMLGTVIGAVIAILVSYNILGLNSIKLGAELTASYIGGAENDVAMKQALNIPNELFTAVFSIDNLITSLWMIITLVLGGSLLKTQKKMQNVQDHCDVIDGHDTAKSFGIFNILFCLLAGLFVYILANMIYEYLQFISPILYVTILSIIVGQIPLFRKWLAPSYRLGCVIFIFFFFSIGALSGIGDILKLPIYVVIMPLIVVGTHGTIIYIAAKLLRTSPLMTGMVSQSLVGGPSTAIAYAQAKNWQEGIPLAVTLGLTGYCVANLCGFLIYKVMLLILMT